MGGICRKVTWKGNFSFFFYIYFYWRDNVWSFFFWGEIKAIIQLYRLIKSSIPFKKTSKYFLLYLAPQQFIISLVYCVANQTKIPMLILYRRNAQRILDKKNTTIGSITPYIVDIFESFNDTKDGGHLCSYAGDNGLFCHFDRPTLFSRCWTRACRFITK
jgi:hypothetical protein